MKICLKLTLFFMTAMAALAFIVETISARLQDNIVTQSIQLQATELESLINANKDLADTFFYEVINKEEILQIIAAIVNGDKEQQRVYRGLLYRKLSPAYRRNRENIAQILHFHTPDNHSLLRFHLPQKSGDDLTAMRPSVGAVNQSLVPVHGFEDGRGNQAFRNVYPLFYQQQHIGSVEISQNGPPLFRKLEELRGNDLTRYFFYHLKEGLFAKLFKEYTKYYVEGEINPHYVRQKYIPQLYADTAYLSETTPVTESIFAKIRQNQQLQGRIKDKENFGSVIKDHATYYLVIFQFIPDISKKGGGYLVSVAPETSIKALITNTWLTYSALGIFLLLGVIYRGVLEKDLCQKKHNSKLMETITSSMGEGLYVTDVEGNTVYCNPAMESLLGYLHDEIYGQNAHDLFHVHIDKNRCPLKIDPDHIQQIRCPETVFRHKSGQLIPISSVSTPIIENGKQVSTIVVVHNLTERKQLEGELRDSEERFRTLSNATFEGILIHDGDGVAIDVNDSFTQLVGYTRSELIGVNLIQTLIPEKYHLSVAHHRSFEIAFPYEIELRKKDGTLFAAEVESRNIDFPGKRYRVTALRDISARKRIEREKRELEKQLQQKYKMEAVGEMAGGIAHNFNNNLAIILGHLQLLERKFPETTQPTFKKYIDNAKTAALRSRDLVAQIMTYSRISGEGVSIIDPSAAISEIINLLESTLPATVTLTYHNQINGECPRIKADRGRLQEALHNLCNNAVHAMSERGNLTIELSCRFVEKQNIPLQYECAAGHYVQIAVKDDGCGMPQTTVNKIFDPFFTTKNIGQGTGLGLSTVQGIVRLYDGFITLHSEVDQGTSFTLNFPANQEKPTTAIQENAEQIPHGNEKILLVDDEEMLVHAVQEMLEGIGYTVDALRDPRRALERFNASPEEYQLVITDQTMPGLTGKELVAEMRKVRKEAKIILCTGYSNKISQADVDHLKLQALLLKPLVLEDLANTVRRVLDAADS